MRTILLILLTTSVIVKAQLTITTSQREYFYYNDSTQKGVVTDSYKEYSEFKFNKDLTSFIHTTPKMESFYSINSLNEEDNGKEIMMNVTSDAGNNYLLLINYIEKKIFFQIAENRYLSFYIKDIIKNDTNRTVTKIDDNNYITEGFTTQSYYIDNKDYSERTVNKGGYVLFTMYKNKPVFQIGFQKDDTYSYGYITKYNEFEVTPKDSANMVVGNEYIWHYYNSYDDKTGDAIIKTYRIFYSDRVLIQVEINVKDDTKSKGFYNISVVAENEF